MPAQDYWSHHFRAAAAQRTAEQRRLHAAALAALLVHGLLFALRHPEASRHTFSPVVPRLFRLQPLQLKPREKEPPLPFVPAATAAAQPTIVVPGPPEVDPQPVDEPIPIPITLLPEVDLLAMLPAAPPAVEPVADLPVRYDSSLARPERLFAPLPAYTDAARRARLQGRVGVEAVIDVDGAVVDAKVVHGLGLGLDESALAAVNTWRFTPARRRGQPVPVIYNLVINFRLD
jgi:TonB family protein